MATRYARQEAHPWVGKEGQEKLRNSSVCVVGLGAIGSISAELLARAGIGTLTLIDRDIVDTSNLPTQLYCSGDVGKAKAEQAREILEGINPDAAIRSFPRELTHKTAHLMDSDALLDCTDNLETRFLINDYCRKSRIPWVHSSALQHFATVLNITPEGPCFRCIFREASGLESCETAGVLNSTAAAAASFQASEALKLLLGKPHETRLLRINLLRNELLRVSIAKRSGCKSCQGRYEYLDGKGSRAAKLCGSGTYQITGTAVELADIEKRLSGKGSVHNYGSVLRFQRPEDGIAITVFEDGRALLSARTPGEAKSLYSRYVGN